MGKDAAGTNINDSDYWARMLESIPASYTVWKDGDTYRAECNLEDGTDYNGADAGSVVGQAIDALSNGGVVFVKAGTYTCSSQIYPTDNIALVGEGDGTIFEMADGKNFVGLIRVDGYSNVTLYNFKVDGNKSGQTNYGRGVYVRDAGNVKICNLTVVDCYQHGIQIYGPPTETTHHLNVEGNYVTNCDYSGILATGGALTDLRIMNNEVEACTGSNNAYDSAIRVDNGQRVIIAGNICDANSGTDDNNAGIQLRDVSGRVIVNGNVCSNGGSQGILWYDSPYVIISNNSVYNNTNSGLYNEGSPHSSIIGNHVQENGKEGIVLGSYGTDYSNDSIVQGNLCYRNGDNGILVGGTADRSTIQNNICRENSYGDTPGVDAGISVRAGYCSVAGNILSDSQGTATQKYGIEEDTSGHSPDYNVYKNNVCTGHLTAPYLVSGSHNAYDGKIRTATSVDLSGGAETVVVHQFEEAAHLARATLVYTEASSSDAGVTIELGKANGTTDRDYYYTGTSETDKAIWYNTQLTLLTNDVTAGDTVTFYSAGGKTGTGEIMVIIDYLVGA